MSAQVAFVHFLFNYSSIANTFFLFHCDVHFEGDTRVHKCKINEYNYSLLLPTKIRPRNKVEEDNQQ